MEFSSNSKTCDQECLMSSPEEQTIPIERPSVKISDNCQKFRLKDRNFMRQYAHLYSERLMTMRTSVENAAKKKWGMKKSLITVWSPVTDHYVNKVKKK